MLEKYSDLPLEFLVMDVKDLHFEADSFDSVIDKGTLDCLLCGERSSIMMNRALTQISKVLKPGGAFALVTYGDPESRMRFLGRPQLNWTVRHYSIAKPIISNTYTLAIDDPDHPGVHYIFICTKNR